MRKEGPRGQHPHEVELGFLAGGGEMGALMRAHDWAHSSLGHPERWPQSLRTVVRLILNTRHPMYIWWGAELACLYNDAYTGSIGPERHPVSLGKPAREVWAEIWDVIGPQIEQVMSGGGATWNVNHLVPITRHGRREEVYWTYSFSPIDEQTAPNGIGGVLVICSETTEQVQKTHRLAFERDQLAQLFEQTPSFMTMLRGPGHVFELANPAYQRLVGDRAILGKTVAEALPETVAQGYIALLDQVYTSGKAFVAHDARYTNLAPDGTVSELFLDFVYQPIKNDEGRVTGIFVEGTDVTERAHSVAALTASEGRFRALADELAEANRLKDEFVATLAHELRNPLAPMRNALELIKRSPGGEAVAPAREMIERQVTQMVRLIDDLLDLSRVSRGLVELRRTRLSLADAIYGALETSRPLIEEHGHTISVTLPPESLIIDADPTRIVQVIANLLNNAAKFTPNGGHISVTLARDGDDAVVSVRDDGVGVPREMVDKIFDLFTQVDRTHARTGGGLGIGLTLVKRLVELHGGRVEAHSRGPGTGSEFRIYLPLGKAAEAPAPSPVSEATAAGAHLRHRVLVADDNEDAAESLAQMLDLLGYETRTAHDGAEALRTAREFRPDAMVLDIAMPELNGHELARRVRAEPWAAGVLLIAASGWGQESSKRESRAAGFDAHLVKPLDLDTLERLLEAPRR